MKKFTFSLEAVLKLRQRREEMAQKDFAMALSQVQMVRAKIDNKQIEINNCFQADNYRGGQQISVHDLVDNRRYVEHLYFEMEELMQDLQEKETVARHKQHFLMMATEVPRDH